MPEPGSKPLVALSRDAPVVLADALATLEGVDVLTEAPETAILTHGSVTRADPEVVGLEEVAEAAPGSSRLWLVNGVLDDAAAARLEDLDIGFVDRNGRWWLPGVARTATSAPPGPQRRMRGPQIRLAQLLADHPGTEWTQRLLAERGHSTQQTAHRLLTRLEHEGLLERAGAGRSSRRFVADTRRFRAWLAHTCAPGRASLLRCYVPEPLNLADVGVPLALTGSHAADALGMPVMSGRRPPVYRARTTRAGLEELPSKLGGVRTPSGANLLLVVDLDDLAHLDASDVGGRLVAPPSRVMLDLHLEPRGTATAAVFLDLWSRSDSRE